jgi:hypothetical protein
VVNQPNIYSQTCLKGYIFKTNRGRPTIYTVKPAFTGISLQQLVVNQPYIIKPALKGTSLQQIVVRIDSIYGWFTMICCIDVPFKSGLTVYMVSLPRFVVKMYPLRQV